LLLKIKAQSQAKLLLIFQINKSNKNGRIASEIYTLFPKLLIFFFAMQQFHQIFLVNFSREVIQKIRMCHFHNISHRLMLKKFIVNIP
jgi:hypothetical protein